MEYGKLTQIICKWAMFCTYASILEGSNQTWPRLTRNSLGTTYFLLDWFYLLTSVSLSLFTLVHSNV